MNQSDNIEIIAQMVEKVEKVDRKVPNQKGEFI